MKPHTVGSIITTDSVQNMLLDAFKCSTFDALNADEVNVI